MKARLPMIYLAGAIRDDVIEDIQWRERAIRSLAGLAVVINPLGGKQFDETTKEWFMSGRSSTAHAIVRHDGWSVDRSDIVLADLRGLSQGYPNIGTLLELGRAWGGGKLIYTVLDSRYKGHTNAMFALHPFLAEIGAINFETVDEALWFLARHLRVLSGENPKFDGILRPADTVFDPGAKFDGVLRPIDTDFDPGEIMSEKEYSEALARIYALLEAAPDSPEGKELDGLVDRVAAYEEAHFDGWPS